MIPPCETTSARSFSPTRDASRAPGQELCRGELPRVLALAQDLGPVGERAHLTEDTVADDAAHLRQEAGIGVVETAGDELRGLLRSRQRAREHERVRTGALRDRLRHRPARGRERAFVVLEIGALDVTANL